MMRKIERAALAACACLWSGVCLAADAAGPYRQVSRGGFISELRLGAFAHDPASPEQGAVDVNGEILFAKPFSGSTALFEALIPRFDVGGTGNFAGKTSHAYAGLSWIYDFTDKIFVEGALGAAVHNGHAGPLPAPGRNAMGCAWGFRESASAGYRFTSQWSLMGTVEHVSNSGLCSQNRGLTNMGLRAGYAF